MGYFLTTMEVALGLLLDEPDMIKIELTQEQAQQLIQLIDIAIKAGGIANAKAGLPLVDIIIAAAQPKSE